MSSTRSGVMGFTEAELGLFLALLFIGSTAYGSGSASPPAPAARTRSADSSMIAVVARLAAERDSLVRLSAQLGQRVTALGENEARLTARRDSLAALPTSTISAVIARRTQLGDSITSVIDSLRVAREAMDAEQRIAVNQRELVEVRLEPILREEASIMGVVATARRERDSVLRAVRPGDTATVRRYARRVDSLSEISVDPARRVNMAKSSGAATALVALTDAESAAAAAESRGVTVTTAAGTGRSGQTPTCIELGIASGYIATVTILNRDLFRVRGQEGSVGAVLVALANEQREAARANCRHVIRVTTVPGLAVDSYVPALVELRRTFNTALVGPAE